MPPRNCPISPTRAIRRCVSSSGTSYCYYKAGFMLFPFASKSFAALLAWFLLSSFKSTYLFSSSAVKSASTTPFTDYAFYLLPTLITTDTSVTNTTRNGSFMRKVWFCFPSRGPFNSFITNTTPPGFMVSFYGRILSSKCSLYFSWASVNVLPTSSITWPSHFCHL